MRARGEHCIGPRPAGAGAAWRVGLGAGGVPAAAQGCRCGSRRVVTGCRHRRVAGGGDVAGLVLTEEAPDGAAPARFAAATPEPGTRLRVFGYPGSPARENGMWVDVDLKGEVGGQLIQVESREWPDRQSAARLQRVAGVGSRARVRRSGCCRPRRSPTSRSVTPTC